MCPSCEARAHFLWGCSSVARPPHPQGDPLSLCLLAHLCGRTMGWPQKYVEKTWDVKT